jgi:hypothetical protein
MSGRLRTYNAVCSKCYQWIDLEMAARAIYLGTEYRHGCGRVLIQSTPTTNEKRSTRTHSQSLSSGSTKRGGG